MRRVSGRVVVAVMVAIGLLFVLLNLLVRHSGPAAPGPTPSVTASP